MPVPIPPHPGPLDPRTIYMVFQDKVFVPKEIEASDPTWPKIMPNTRSGDSWYPHVYEPDRWQLDQGGSTPDPSAVPEFFGDTILVNGTLYPVLEVEQRQYRFRSLNACNARFLNPRLVYARGASFPHNCEPQNKLGPEFIQFGTEGRFLHHPTMLNGHGQRVLLLAPAERADLIVDFRDVPTGSTLILYNNAPAPYPMGDDLNDYFPGNEKNPTPSQPGFGPNTHPLLQIRVKDRKGAANPPITLPSRLHPTDPFIVDQHPGHPTPIPKGVPVLRLTLNEVFDEHGRLIQFLGTNQPVNPESDAPEFGRPYEDSPTEVIQQGSTEVWEIANLTGDTHPIHFHLVNIQVLSRQPFDVAIYQGGKPNFTGPDTAPDDNELGWKETVRMNPTEVT